jgi:lambda repressor-like predicted transcriptional regulator
MASRARRCCVSKAREPPGHTSRVELDERGGAAHQQAQPLRELGALRLTQLMSEAEARGVAAHEIEDAEDSEDPKAALIGLILLRAKACAPELSPALAALRRDLRGLKRSEMKKRARAAQVDPARLAQAEDCEDSALALGLMIDLICERAAQAEQSLAPADVRAPGHRVTALRAELESMKLSEVKRRARSAGAEEPVLEQAIDSDSPKLALIELVLANEVQVTAPVGGAKAEAEASSAAALRAELERMKLSTLSQRALQDGATQAAVDAAEDSAEPKRALVALVCELVAAGGGRGSQLPHVETAETALRQELQGLRLKELRKRAREAGVDEEALENSTDAPDPKSAVIALLLELSDASSAGDAALRQELQGLRLKELRKMAREAGVDDNALEDALEAGDPKAEVIALLLAARQLTAVLADRPHFGTGAQQTQHTKQVQQPAGARKQGLLPVGKHAMISYQWDDQAHVIDARKMLTKLGVPCWMDIDGGMQQDIYESMADGVENAACVVCFLSQKYQDSENCKLELKFAKQSGVPIVPVMVESTAGWRPSGWLGIVVAGALWTPLRAGADFQSGVRSLVDQIKGAVPESGAGMSDDEDDEHTDTTGTDTGAERRAELERLRKQMNVHERGAATVEDTASSYDPGAPADVTASVPELPGDFRPTEEIKQLQHNLLHSTTSVKVGFWGMGGIGKTVTGAALVRDDAVRDHFDQIVWLPLGQTPVMEKLQSSAMKQLTGKPMESTLSDEERQTALRDAFKGKRVLLALDDLWEEEHAPQLSFVDESCGSRVLISTRIRHLLSDAFAVEIGKPSVEDSISILMAAAELGGTADAPPAEAREIVELCGRLPLALVMAGKLILELEVGDNWDGITSILREELRGNEAATSREQGVIRASLAGLKGSERDKTGARQLFQLFGLVPEDTSCPLECLQMMYDAVYEPDRSTSVLHIRKWLKMLLGRSLVLGTVDRASLHDLVLDFTIGMYSKSELAAAHRRVVEMFRENRVKSPAGLSEWVLLNRDDPVTAYVLDESAHHIRNARDASDPSSDEVLLSWLNDQPIDALHHGVALELGETALVQAAKSSKATGDMWSAACRWACAAYVAYRLTGQLASIPLLHSAIDAVAEARTTAGSMRMAMQMDLLELDVLPLVLQNDIGYNLSDKPIPRIRYLATTAAGKARPDRMWYLQFFAEAMPCFFAGDLERMCSASATSMLYLVHEAAEAQDPQMREWCSILLAIMMGPVYENLPGNFDWAIVGQHGELLRQGLYAYSYSKHHQKLNTDLNQDFFNYNGTPR